MSALACAASGANLHVIHVAAGGAIVIRHPEEGVMPAASEHSEGALAPAESVRSRYAVTFGAQVFRMLLSLVSAAIVPRALGPAVYGNYSFLLSTSAAFRGFIDTGAQQAFFTFSSQQRASGPLTKLYALVIGAQFLLVLVVFGISAACGQTSWLWHGQRPDQIVLVTVFDWLMFLATSLQQLGDSKGLTARLQLTGAAVSLLTIVALSLLWVTRTLDFYSYVWLNMAGAGLTCALMIYRLILQNKPMFWSGALRVRDYAVRWWRFTRPLIGLQYYFPVVAYLGIYLIQKWYRPEEQGYYALALQWCGFAMVFTNSGVWIFWRELAHHGVSRDLRLAAGTYRQFSRLFFFMALVLSCWLSASSGALIQIVAGDRFQAASTVLAIMAFYPIVQTLGQLTTASLKAMERTGSYARWSVLLSIPDLLLTYVLLAPSSAPVPGLHLGAVGMAIKTAMYGLISVEVYDALNCRYLDLPYGAGLARRATALAIVGTLAVVVLGIGVHGLKRIGIGGMTALALASSAYALAIGMLVWVRPGLAGLTRAQIRHGWPAFGRR
jgi:O-antigen/teichoic acid export membrane protein